jgi:hypothetical protein
MGDSESSETSLDEDEDIKAQADQIIKEYIPVRTGHFPEEEEDGIDAASDHIMSMVSRLIKLMGEVSSRAWEREYQFSDLSEEVGRLKDQLRDSVSLGDRANPPRRPMTALEVAYKKAAQARQDDLRNLQQRIQDLEAELEAQRKRLLEEIGKNWMLGYRCRDMGEEVWRLNVWLRNSISFGDVEHPPWKPKTALERALEDKISDLEGRIRNPKGRSRSNTL